MARKKRVIIEEEVEDELEELESKEMDVPTNAFLLVRQQAIDTLQEEEERAQGISDNPEQPAPAPAKPEEMKVGVSGNLIGQIIRQYEGTQPGNIIGNVYEKPYSGVEKIVKEEKEGYDPGFLDYRG